MKKRELEGGGEMQTDRYRQTDRQTDRERQEAPRLKER